MASVALRECGVRRCPERHMSQRSIRVLLVDDHFVVRKGLCALLASSPDIAVIGEAEDGLEAVRQNLRLRPDVILMDLAMPCLDGLEGTRRILDVDPGRRILILSGVANVEEIIPAIRAGALGYVSKDCGAEALMDAIRRLHRGELALPAEMMQRLMLAIDHNDTSVPLTPRERDVLQLLAQGLEDAEIAERLCISRATVRSHVSNLLAKLDLRNRVEATLFALRQGWAQLEPQAKSV